MSQKLKPTRPILFNNALSRWKYTGGHSFILHKAEIDSTESSSTSKDTYTARLYHRSRWKSCEYNRKSKVHNRSRNIANAGQIGAVPVRFGLDCVSISICCFLERSSTITAVGTGADGIGWPERGATLFRKFLSF